MNFYRIIEYRIDSWIYKILGYSSVYSMRVILTSIFRYISSCFRKSRRREEVWNNHDIQTDQNDSTDQTRSGDENEQIDKNGSDNWNDPSVPGRKRPLTDSDRLPTDSNRLPTDSDRPRTNQTKSGDIVQKDDKMNNHSISPMNDHEDRPILRDVQKQHETVDISADTDYQNDTLEYLEDSEHLVLSDITEKDIMKFRKNMISYVVPYSDHDDSVIDNTLRKMYSNMSLNEIISIFVIYLQIGIDINILRRRFIPYLHSEESNSYHILQINLSRLGLHTVPIYIEKFYYLKILDLSVNNLHELPDSIYDMKSIWYLNVSHNNIFEISDKIENMTNLSKLDLSYNRIDTIPRYLFETLDIWVCLTGNPILDKDIRELMNEILSDSLIPTSS